MYADEQLKKLCVEELAWEPSVSPADIGVTAKNGVITLTGDVPSFAEKRAAESAVLRVKGVKGVAQEIEVRVAFESKRADDEIAAAALEHLSWDVSVPKEVKVKVEKGWLTLEGEVKWRFQMDAAEWGVRNLFGVIGVINLIKIKPAVSTRQIVEDIRHALHRSWSLTPEVSVSADGGRVRLSGTVNSPSERAAASRAAWAAPGATSVENDILVA